jgi:hypothetical protein
MLVRHTRPAALTIALLLSLLSGAAHAQQPIGWVLTLLPQYNAVVSARIDRQGGWNWGWGNQAMDGPPPSSATLVHTTSGFLVYDSWTGRGEVMRVFQTGELSRAGKYMFSPGWDIVGTGDFLVFYSDENLSGAVGYITPAGTFVQTESFAPWTMGWWTHIVATDNNVIFYNQSSGWAAIGYIDASGHWNEVSGTSLAQDCWTLAAVGQYLLCMDGPRQRLTVYDIQAPGTAVQTDVVAISNWYHRIVRHGSNIALMEIGGPLVIAHIDENGQFVMTDEQTVLFSTPSSPDPASADLLVSTGDMLLFYRRYTGGAMTGRVNYAGVFQQLQTMDLFPSVGAVVASAAR